MRHFFWENTEGYQNLKLIVCILPSKAKLQYSNATNSIISKIKNMSKNTKILIGVLTLLPLINLFIYLWQIFRLIANFSDKSMAPDVSNITSMLLSVSILALTSIGLMIFYIVHAVNNKKLSGNERIMWILMFIFISTIAFIIYWVLKIWQDRSDVTETNRQGYLDDEI